MKHKTNYKPYLLRSKIIQNLAVEAGYNSGAEFINDHPATWLKSESEVAEILEGEIKEYGGFEWGPPIN